MSQYKLVRAAMRGRIAVLSITLLTLGLTLFAQSAWATSDETVNDTFPASVTPLGVYANGEGTAVYGPVSISDDGRYVAFESNAANLGEGPVGVAEAYVKDLHTGEVELVSRANGSNGLPASEPGIENLKISGNGRYVTFNSKATNLITGLPGEEPEEQHVYRRDLQTGETTLVDRVTGIKGAILSRGAVAEAISRDGQYVVFAADVNDLENPTSGHAKTSGETVYVRDVDMGTTTAVSRADGPNGVTANQESQAYSISADGRYVPFVTRATNLVPGMESNIFQQVYLRDLQTGTTTLVSQIANGQAGEGRSENPVLVGEDGCEVEFNSEVYNLLEPPSIDINGEAIEISGPQVYLRNLCSTPAVTTLLSQNETGIAGDSYGVFGGSSDGSELLFAGEFLSGYHLFLRDLDTGQTTQLDRASGANGISANEESEQAAISANGCRAVFDSQATNLLSQSGSPEGPNGEKPTEVYVRQLAACNEEPTVMPASLSFPTQPLGTVGAGQPVTVTAGFETLQIHSVQPTGANAADFIVTGDECSGETLQPTEKCTLLVRFAPSATGPRSASLIVHAANAEGLEVALTGEGSLPVSGEQGMRGEPGSEGPQGRQGASGPRGLIGAQGQTGARGEKGPRGLPAPEAKVTCRLRKNTHKLTCSVRFSGKKAGQRVLAALTKDGRTYARGSLASLHLSRAIRPGAYTLHLIIDGHTLAVQVRLT